MEKKDIGYVVRGAEIEARTGNKNNSESRLAEYKKKLEIAELRRQVHG